MPQRYEELCEFSIRLVEHEENMPRNYVRFHIPREMTKYELYNYLGKILISAPIESVCPHRKCMTHNL